MMVNASDTITSGRHPVRNLPLMEPTEKKGWVQALKRDIHPSESLAVA
jgi:hypothetical protein